MSEIKRLVERTKEDEAVRKAYWALRDYSFLCGKPRRLRVGDVEILVSPLGVGRAHAIIASHALSFKGSAKDIEQAMRSRGIDVIVNHFNRDASSLTVTMPGGRLAAGFERRIIVIAYCPSPEFIDDVVKKFVESLSELGWLKPDPLPSAEEAYETLSSL